MSVDKFGRHANRRVGAGVIKGPKGNGFDLTPEGNFDIGGKNLTNVRDPLKETDAVNLKTLHENCVVLSRPDKQDFDARNKRIRSVASPVDDSDAIDYGTVKKLCVRYEQSGDPAAVAQRLSKFIDAKGHRIENIDIPVKGNDAATKRYVDVNTPIRDVNHWAFWQKRLASVADPVEDTDAVTLKYLKSNTILRNSERNEFDGNSCTISNLANPRYPSDAVNKRYMREALAGLSYAIYSIIRRRTIPSTQPLGRDEWRAKVVDEEEDSTVHGTAWDTLFKS